MQSSSIEEFLTEEQRQLLSKSIQAIKAKLKKMPAKYTALLLACQSEDLKYLAQIDPQGGLLLQKLAKINEDVLYEQFKVIGQTIIQLVTYNIGIYEQAHSLAFLKVQISNEVNRICESQTFNLRIEEAHSMSGNSLWETLHDELIEVLMGISGFMHNHYEMTVNQERRELEVNDFLQNFRQKFQGKNKLSKLYVLNERIETEMISFKNQSKIIDQTEQEDDWAKIMKLIDEIEKKQEEQQTKNKEQEKIVQLQIAQIGKDENRGNEKSKNILAIIGKKSQNIFKNVKALITKSSPYEQKYIQNIEIEENLQNYVENLEQHLQLSNCEIRQVERMTKMSLHQLQYELQGKFTSSELSIIQYSINNPIKKWDQHQKAMNVESELSNRTMCELLKYSAHLHCAVQMLRPGDKIDANGQLLLVGLFYRVLESNYCPFIKRYLMKVLRVIENQLARSNKVYLRGALRIFETSTIRPTRLATLLSTQRPSRSEGFELSNKSVLYHQNTIFENDARIRQQIDNYLLDIKKQQKFREQIPQVQFFRLNSSPQTKTVTIAISGFLSEDSAKDLEWMGLIRALENTELYSLSWKISTLKQTGRYVAQLAGELLFNQVMKPGPVGLIGNIINIGQRIVTEYKNNPFATAHSRAVTAGIYLAQFIRKTFPDRFINLVGFSLGTEVIAHCLIRLSMQGQLELINKIVMLGGAASQQCVKNFLQKAPTSLQVLNLWSEGDYSIKYIYRLCRLGSIATGAGNLPHVSGHEVVNINSSKFVQSHMDFRCNLYGIGRLTGLIHD